jgi:hypothetical protein
MKTNRISIVICLLSFFGCTSPQEIKPLNDLKKTVKNDIELYLMKFDIKYAENPAIGKKPHQIAFGIHSNFKSIYSIINSSNPVIDSIQKHLQYGLEYFGPSKIERDSSLNQRLDIINKALGNSKISIKVIEYLLYDLENHLLTKTYNDIEKNWYKFNDLKAVVVPEKKNILVGETYHAKIYIAAFDTTRWPVIKFKDSFLPIEDGYGILNIKGTSTGLKEYNGIIEWRPDGQPKIISLPYDIIYTVKIK